MIKAQNLNKSFGALIAINNISLEINRGDVVGFLGTNGSGKSTTMRLLTGFLPADSGSIEICGHDIASDKQSAQSCIGYLPEAADGFSNLTAEEFLKFCCGCRGFNRSEKKNAIDRIVQEVELQSVLNKKLYSLSKGWRQRVWLAQALIHNPSVLILDEPTDGLDPNQKDQIRELICSFGSDKAVVLSTHILEEAEEVCNRVIVINQGKLVVDSATDKLTDDRGRLSTAFRKLTFSLKKD